MDCSDGFGYFPDEVILQILARLPIKSLYWAKSVCRRWYDLSSCEYFVRVYDHASVRRLMVLVEVSELSDSIPSFICIGSSWGVSALSLNFLRDRVDVRASCNGLLCCSSVPDKGVYYVCNPMTREYRLLPSNRAGMMNRFHSCGEATLVGLACDVALRKFNVVLVGYRRTFGHRPDGSFVCFVFDSRSGKWRKFVSSQDDRFSQIHKNQGVFVSSALHWLTDTPSWILAIDLQYDVCRKVCLPEQLNEYGHRVYLLELEGCLSVVEILENWMKIWVLKCYEAETWELVDTVSLRCIQGLAPGIFPISQTEDYMFLNSHKQVLLYNRKSRMWKEVYSVKNGSVLPLWGLPNPLDIAMRLTKSITCEVVFRQIASDEAAKIGGLSDVSELQHAQLLPANGSTSDLPTRVEYQSPCRHEAMCNCRGNCFFHIRKSLSWAPLFIDHG